MLSAAAAAIWVDHRVCTEPDTIIRPYMQLEISLDGVPPPAKLMTVDIVGRIELPLLGKLKASGLTCAQLETKLTEAYNGLGVTKYVQVYVRVAGFQPPGGL